MVRVGAGLAAALVVLVLAGLLASRVVDLRYVNIPVLHPYPPSGYIQNPFNPTDRADLIPAAAAAKVKADLLADGKIEVDAAATGDSSMLATVETGRSLAAVMGILDANAKRGVVEKSSTALASVIVGRLADPSDGSITWCVEERGTTTLTYVRRDTGAIAEQTSFRIVGKFWLVKQGARYLIADRMVTSQ